MTAAHPRPPPSAHWPVVGPAASGRARPKVGLALAGGGPLGAVYEVGALCALAEALPDLDLTALDGYVGVSAGGFIAAGLANGMTPRQLCTSFIENDGPRSDLIRPNLFFRPALGEYARRLAAVPWLLLQAGWGVAVQRPAPAGRHRTAGQRLAHGLFSNAALQAQLARRVLGAGAQQRLPAAAPAPGAGGHRPGQRAGRPFGLPGWDHVPISQAVAASAALPGLFPPEEIDGRWYVDGALKKTLHARVLLDLGLDLMICLNPMVPFDASAGHSTHRVLGGASKRIPIWWTAACPWC